MNPYLQNLRKIEFVVTYACTGKCKHCSEGDHSAYGEHIDAKAAALAVEKVAERYPIQTVMTFGGEPLLYPDAVFFIHKTAMKMQIPHRQVITNGYFSKDVSRMKWMAQNLKEAGVNDLLISADAFHQETIPLDTVKQFALLAREESIPIRIQPAWLVGEKDPNIYNQMTNRILDEFRLLGFSIGQGNVIFPEGNAKKYLGRYFTSNHAENPYTEDPRDVKCLSFDPNGDILNGNLYQKDILDILRDYTVTEEGG